MNEGARLVPDPETRRGRDRMVDLFQPATLAPLAAGREGHVA
jgi:hypothetical protein